MENYNFYIGIIAVVFYLCLLLILIIENRNKNKIIEQHGKTSKVTKDYISKLEGNIELQKELINRYKEYTDMLNSIIETNGYFVNDESTCKPNK